MYLLLILLSISLGLYKITVGESHPDFNSLYWLNDISFFELLVHFSSADGLYGGFYPPFYFILAKFYGEIFGYSLISFRLFSLVAYFLTIIFIKEHFYKITKISNNKYLFFFLLLIITSPTYIYAAQTAKYTMWLTFISIVGITYGLIFLEKCDMKSGFLLAIILTIMIYTHYFSTIFSFSIILILFINGIFKKDKSFLKNSIIVSLITFFLIIPILIVQYKAYILRLSEPYFFQDKEIFYYITRLVKGLIIESIFGIAFIQEHTFSNLLQKRIFNIDTTLLFLGFFSTLIIFCFSVYAAYYDKTLKTKLLYFGGVFFLIILISKLINIRIAFQYIHAITFCIFSTFILILNKFKFKKLVLFPIIVVLLLNLYSLNNYYSNRKNAYLGIETIENYLDNVKSNYKIYIHDLVKYTTGSFEHKDQYNYISSFDDFISTEIEDKNLIFYFGSPSLIKDDIASINEKSNYIKFEHVYSVKSMYHIYRSINVISALRLN